MTTDNTDPIWRRRSQPASVPPGPVITHKQQPAHVSLQSTLMTLYRLLAGSRSASASAAESLSALVPQLPEPQEGETGVRLQRHGGRPIGLDLGVALDVVGLAGHQVEVDPLLGLL